MSETLLCRLAGSATPASVTDQYLDAKLAEAIGSDQVVDVRDPRHVEAV